MCNKKNPIIGIIDSGIGGVSVLNALIEKYGAGNYIYFADNRYFPYGNKSKTFIRNRVESIINLMINTYHVDYIILACNTASSSIDISSHDNVICMKFHDKYPYLATTLTKQNINNKVIADSRFATLIDQHIFNHKRLDRLVFDRIEKHHLDKLDTLVLGCTHYELVSDVFKKYCPKTKIINNSSFVLDEINFDIVNTTLNISIILSRQSEKDRDKIRRIIKSK